MSEAGAALRVMVPGAGMVAVCFGLARYGYGLLLPDLRADLGISAGVAGLIGSGVYLSYLAANALAVMLGRRAGPRLPLALATAAATGGMAVIAVSEGPVGVAAGAMVAGAAAGLAFPLYADLVAVAVPAAHRAVAWSVVSSGTGWGVAVAGPVAIAFGAWWRAVWWVFAALAAVIGALAVRCAPRGRAAVKPVPDGGTRRWWRPGIRRVLLSAILLGAGSSVWWVFSIDALRAVGLHSTATRVVYAVCGAAGVLASTAGWVAERIGVRRCYLIAGAALAASLVLLAATTSSVIMALAAATVFGVAYNGVIAAQGLWNAALFPDRPGDGLTAVNTALTGGTIAGPVLAGALVQAFGYPIALLAAAAAVAAALLQGPAG
jgi:predicted MFS family arabinose efflux permease